MLAYFIKLTSKNLHGLKQFFRGNVSVHARWGNLFLLPYYFSRKKYGTIPPCKMYRETAAAKGNSNYFKT